MRHSPTAGRILTGVLISAAAALLVWSVSSCDQRVRDAATKDDLRASETRVREDVKGVRNSVDQLVNTLLQRTASETTANTRQEARR